MQSMQLISLCDIDAASRADIGGKAINLIHLAGAGIPVPDGWVIPADAFRRHLHGLGIVELQMNLNETSLAKLRDQILIADLELPLQEALAALPTVPLAVRSSATVEDQAAASYSGIFHTVLGVSGTVELTAAIKHVWASVFTPEALSYHRQMSAGSSVYPAMAVLIMPMVLAKAAGIAFSADPAAGNPFVIVISAAHGLGTTVVDGSEDCDRYCVDWDTLQVLEERRGEQRSGVFLTPDGRQAKRPLTAVECRQPALDNLALRQVAELVYRIDELFGMRVDVEFAVTGGEVFILQARPLVGLPAWFPDNPLTDPTVHIAGGNWERCLSPFMRARYEDSAQPNVPPPPWPLELAGFLVRHGRLFFRESPKSEFEERPDAHWEDRTFLWRMWTLADPGEDFAAWYDWVDAAYAKIIPALRALAESLLRLSPETLERMTANELLDLLDTALETDSLAASFYISAAGSTSESLRQIDILAKDWITGGDYEQSAQLALTMMQGMHKLTHDLELQIEAAARGELTVEEIACRWGYSFLNMEDMVDITWWRSWREDPAPLEAAIALMRQQPTDIAPRLQAAAQVSEERLQQTLIALRDGDADEGEHRAHIFAACVAACRRCFSLKDDRDFVLSHAEAALRWILLGIGRRFCRDGTLQSAEEIFLLQSAEMRRYLTEPNLEAIAHLVKERYCEQQRLTRYSLPKLPAEQSESINEVSDVLQGSPASPGIATGPARLVENATDAGHIHPGEIVCLKGERRVGWTLYFPSIAGMVYENGNWLCHESNLCRELGIPAVVNLGQQIHLLLPGERLRIDGTKGIVMRMCEEINDAGD